MQCRYVSLQNSLIRNCQWHVFERSLYLCIVNFSLLALAVSHTDGIWPGASSRNRSAGDVINIDVIILHGMHLPSWIFYMSGQCVTGIVINIGVLRKEKGKCLAAYGMKHSKFNLFRSHRMVITRLRNSRGFDPVPPCSLPNTGGWGLLKAAKSTYSRVWSLQKMTSCMSLRLGRSLQLHML